MLDNLTRQCGFSEAESKLLSYLLLHGAQRASVLAQRVGLKRPTAYAALDSLIDVGIVTRKRVRGGSVFAAVSPQMLNEMLRTRSEAQHERTLNALQLLKGYLADLPYRGSREYAGLQIETIESEKAIYAHLYEWLVSGSFCGVFDPQISISAKTKGPIAKFLKISGQNKPHIREIAVSGPMCSWYRTHIQNPNHELREISGRNPFPADFILIKDRFIFIDYTPPHETAICIWHPKFAATLQSMFELLWTLLPPNSARKNSRVNL